MHLVHNLNAGGCNTIENDIVRMGNNLAQAGNSLALTIQIGMFGSRQDRLFQQAFHTPCRWRILVGDVANDIRQVIAGRGPPDNG